MTAVNELAASRKASKASKASTRRVRKAGTEGANWLMVHGEAILVAVAAVAKQGGALRFGYTRDGGAYSIGVYGDGDPYTDYIKPDESVEEYLYALAESWK